MPEFLVTMRIEHSGVWAYVTADSPEEAREKAERGEWHDMDTAGADVINWAVQKVETNQ